MNRKLPETTETNLPPITTAQLRADAEKERNLLMQLMGAVPPKQAMQISDRANNPDALYRDVYGRETQSRPRRRLRFSLKGLLAHLPKIGNHRRSA